MKLLLMAGSGEARLLARALAGMDGVSTVASLAGATRAPARLAVETRRGGFGGRAAQAEYMRAQGFDAVLDATHPFAHRIKARTAAIAAEIGLPCLHLIRPPWRPGPGDAWTEIAEPAEASAHIPPGATVFLATGRGTLAGFATLRGRRVISRQIELPEAPFPWEGGEYLPGRPPFSVADELALFKRLQVDWLVVKNAGGEGARAKLDAARRLGIPVLLLARPAPPRGPIVSDTAAALAWVERQRDAKNDEKTNS